MLLQPATQTFASDSFKTRLVEIYLIHVQNRPKTVRVRAKAPERRTKFDPDETVSQLNRIGHDFSRVQVEKGRFTYKCRRCFLRGERTFLKQLLGKPCSSRPRDALPLPDPDSVPHASSTPDEPESFFIGDTPSSEDDPFGWGGEFDRDHQAKSDQDLPFSPDRQMHSAEGDLRLLPYPERDQVMDDAGELDPATVGLAHCASGIRDAPCDAVVQAGKFQGRDDADVVVTAADNQEPRIFWNGGLHP